jgi:hypothetical protein
MVIDAREPEVLEWIADEREGLSFGFGRTEAAVAHRLEKGA